MYEKVHITVSRYNGIQVSIEGKSGDSWTYIGAGYNRGKFDLTYGTAGPEAGDDAAIRSAASAVGEEPARYAAANHMWGADRIFEIEI